MKNVKVKVPAKVNFTLEICGKEGKFHNLKSVVASINLFDVITLSKREDDKINVVFSGDESIDKENNNVVKTVKLFNEQFNCGGVDILVERNIPVGAGLGSSSADIAGTLLGLKKLFKIRKGMGSLAEKLGSDSAYMIDGGFALLEGKGDKITRFKSKIKMHLLIVKENAIVKSSDCYNMYDELNIEKGKWKNDAKEFLERGDFESFAFSMINDLYIPAIKLCPKIGENVNTLKQYAPSSMTGSGTATFAIFKSKRKRNSAYKKLYKKYGANLIKAKTLKK